MPDERLGEILATNVCVRDESRLNETDLNSFLATKLANFKIPAHIWIQKISCLGIASGKIAKKDLRASAIKLLGK